MQTFLTICLLATSVATGASLLCESCSAFGYDCNGRLESCPSDKDVCRITEIESSSEELRIAAVVKSCFHSRDCSKPISSIETGLAGLISTVTTCYVGNEREKILPNLPPKNTTLNGHKCPTCYNEYSFECAEVDAKCTGDNIYCGEITGTADCGFLETLAVPFVLKGCTNQNDCNHVREVLSSESVGVATCKVASKASRAIPRSSLFFLQTFSGILLLKFLN
ncbi:phospholipase A2 inhibitor and Ly6/PLAUR domain-containing protein-like [Eublepharis macularius]|uniref:Phospholipase A2 inhibitor and Ly6/PLAUR domain-containing protein-like n=1 Tax=Eublepharis macularius TaxID=481883 RepID=A0AA97KF86_EUBMA|nr:phospholipase A2 inhibitor and Ly6/PLAUR domain-containing protein-like [Eublepharis macularius]